MADRGRILEVRERRRRDGLLCGRAQRKSGRRIETEDGAQVGSARPLEREAIRLGGGERLFVRQHDTRGEFLESQAREESEPLVLLAALRAMGLRVDVERRIAIAGENASPPPFGERPARRSVSIALASEIESD